MSFFAYFSFSSGLRRSLWVPKGTLASIMEHVSRIEEILQLEREEYCWTDTDGKEHKNPPRWKSADLSEVEPEANRRLFYGINLEDHGSWAWNHPSGPLFDDLVCATVDWHNDWVRGLYADFTSWSKVPVKDGEKITPKQGRTFWHALRLLEVPVTRWSRSYFLRRMESLYQVMRGRDDEGVSFDEEPLTQQQAAAVIKLFGQYLDVHDLRLDVPRGLDGEGYDYLASSYDGGYVWCENCGPMHPDVWEGCSKGRDCPLIGELCDEERRDILGGEEERSDGL